jgi:hypothetical protein
MSSIQTQISVFLFLIFLWNITQNNLANKYNLRTCQGSCLQSPISKYMDYVNFSSTLNHYVPDFSEYFWKCSCMCLTWPHCSHSVWQNNYKYTVLLHHVVNTWCQRVQKINTKVCKIQKKSAFWEEWWAILKNLGHATAYKW